MPDIEGRCPHVLDPWIRVPYAPDSWRSFLTASLAATVYTLVGCLRGHRFSAATDAWYFRLNYRIMVRDTLRWQASVRDWKANFQG